MSPFYGTRLAQSVSGAEGGRAGEGRGNIRFQPLRGQTDPELQPVPNRFKFSLCKNFFIFFFNKPQRSSKTIPKELSSSRRKTLQTNFVTFSGGCGDKRQILSGLEAPLPGASHVCQQTSTFRCAAGEGRNFREHRNRCGIN